MSFERKLEIGKLGETATKNFYKQHGKELLDVSEDPDWQELDIDFLERHKLTRIESKTDLNPAASVLVEHIENVDSGRMGWLHRSCCNVLTVYKAIPKTLILLDFQKLKKHCCTLLKAGAAEIIKPKRYPKTRNICLSLDSLISLGIIVGMYTLTENHWLISDYFQTIQQELLYLAG